MFTRIYKKSAAYKKDSFDGQNTLQRLNSCVLHF